ncbi:MAG: hypothetical protein II961_08675 [Candidatus Riflebacteria bacterium]|nr:hypothetical protein [Candidatus Riflebacteria bacterium]
MKNFKLFIFYVSFFNIYVSACFAITQERLIDYLAGAHDLKTVEHSISIGLENWNMLPDILIMPSGHSTARLNAMRILNEARRKGFISNERFISIMINQLKNNRLYTSNNEIVIQTEVNRIDFLVSCMNYREWEGGALTTLDVNYTDAGLIVNKMKEYDLIKNNGLKNSLAKKYENSLKSLKKGNKTPAINILEAAKNEINAQSGKGIDTTAASILIRYTDNLIAHINSTN